jgi:hypothetical protein
VATLELNGAGGSRVRVVVLGASNVSRGLAVLSAIVRTRASGPVDLFVAAGHGRSYGVNSRVVSRRLPSILGCGLWRALDRDTVGREQSVALVTDIGNDLLYGFTVDQVAGWVRESLRRLGERAGRVAVTGLPVASVAGVGGFRYRALRTCYVPGCRLSLEELKAAAVELDARVRGIAAEHSAVLIEQPGEWYGFDAIHLRRRRLGDLWHRSCDLWGWAATGPGPAATYAEWMTLGSRSAEVRSLVRRMLFTPQPVIDRPGSFQLSLY